MSGWYLSYVYDPVRDGSDLVSIIIDGLPRQARRLSATSAVRAYGLHGNRIVG